MLPLLSTCFCLLLNARVNSAAGTEEYYGSIAKLEQCPNVKIKHSTIHKMNMNYIGNNMYAINYNITLEKDLEKPLDMKFEVDKCNSEFGPCENYVNYTIVDMCSNLDDEDSIPNYMFKMVNVEPKCPIGKGEYTAEKSEIKIHQSLLEAGKSENFWKFKIYVIKPPDTTVFCLYAEGKIKVAKTTRRSRAKKKRNQH